MDGKSYRTCLVCWVYCCVGRPDSMKKGWGLTKNVTLIPCDVHWLDRYRQVNWLQPTVKCLVYVRPFALLTYPNHVDWWCSWIHDPSRNNCKLYAWMQIESLLKIVHRSWGLRPSYLFKTNKKRIYRFSYQINCLQSENSEHWLFWSS